MKLHDRFESLSGAIALGEASESERLEFAAHAAACALCRDDASSLEGSASARIASARDDETWRPALDRVVLARIHDRQSERSRFAVGALGWAAGLSIAVNVVFVSGLAGQVSRALVPPDPPAAASFGIRLPAQTFAKLPAPALHVTERGLAFVASRRPPHVAHIVPPYRALRVRVAVAHRAAAPLAEPDVFADLLDPDEARDGRKVAIETTFVREGAVQP